MDPGLLEEVMDLLTMLFVRIGLRDDWEPNQLGLKIEDYIDKVNRLRIEKLEGPEVP
jgi:hypothetical protein